MKNAWFSLSLFLLAVLVGCQQPAPATDTPVAPTIAGAPLITNPTSLVTLLRNPAFFEGEYIQLAGQYKRLPLAVCAEGSSRSPVTWALVDGDVEVMASGYDAVLRRLAEPGLPLVIEGRWRQWEGPVGCERRAPIEQVWYLEVANIVAPNPLISTQFEGSALAEAPAEASPPLVEPTEESIPVVPTATIAVATSPAGPAYPPPTAIPTFPPVVPTVAAVTPSPSSTTLATFTPVASSTPALTPSPTATVTVGPGTGTATTAATVTGTPGGTPSVTLTPGSFSPIDYEDLVKKSIGIGAADGWRFVGEVGDTITISAAPTQALNVSIELIDPTGVSEIIQDQYDNGLAETISERRLNMSGVYNIIIRSVANTSGQYALILQESDSLPFVVFQGNMRYGDIKRNSVPVDQDDLWNFEASAGDVISIRAVATGDEDLVLYLKDPSANEVEFVDDDSTAAPPNDEEIIDGYEIQVNGLFTIGVGEGDFNSFEYSLTLERES